MKIVVCVKQIRHVYSRTGMDPSTHFIADHDIVSIVNPLDELAVETALRVKERHGEGEVVLLTLGDMIAEPELRRCFAMGADRLIHLETPPSSRPLDSWARAVVLSAAIARMAPDMVLCGRLSLDDNAGYVGVAIAEVLGIPCVSSIVHLELCAGHSEVVVHRALERGDRDIIRCALPALFTVEKGAHEPRYPSLESLLHAQEKEIEHWSAASLNLVSDAIEPLTTVIRMYPPKPRVKKVRAPTSSMSAQDRIHMLMRGGGAQQKKESRQLLELPPREAAKRAMAFMIEHGFV